MDIHLLEVILFEFATVMHTLYFLNAEMQLLASEIARYKSPSNFISVVFFAFSFLCWRFSQQPREGDKRASDKFIRTCPAFPCDSLP